MNTNDGCDLILSWYDINVYPHWLLSLVLYQICFDLCLINESFEMGVVVGLGQILPY